MIYVYEDELYKYFLPLVYFRPVFNLYCGRLSLFGKIKKLYQNETFGFLVRPVIAPITKEIYAHIKVNEINEPKALSLFLSARAILKHPIEVSEKEEIFVTNENDIIGFHVQNIRIIDNIGMIYTNETISESIIFDWQLPKRQVDAISIKYPWDLIELNHQELIKDFAQPTILGTLSSDAFIIGDILNLYLGNGAEIECGAAIDLHQGPIYIEGNARILAQSKITGPAYIGKNTIIDQGKITASTIGENCRVTGEVEDSIFQGFVNKHHYGFIGHSYVGEWVNLGAGTTNSDLKNNYSTIKVKLESKNIDTGQLKVGCFIGDHAKTAIGTMIPTGAVIGTFANVFEPRANLKSVPNFFWSKGKQWHLDKAIATAKVVMSRRNVYLTKSYENLIRKNYQESHPYNLLT